MKILLSLLFAVCALGFPVAGQSQKNQNDDLKSMVETERAFSRLSEEKGTREAFAEFIAADGILFRPIPVVGKKWMQEHPLPASTTRSVLSWQPIFAFLSSSGDLGYTTGPWQFKQDIKDAKPAGFGNFMTVWKKQTDGSWRFVIDLGISNPEPQGPATPWQMPARAQNNSGSTKPINLEAERAYLILVDREFSNTSGFRGAVAAIRSYADTDVRLLRNGSYPFVGKLAATEALLAVKNEWTWAPTFADVSASGDLGYSYGTYEMRDPAGARAVVEKGNYLRVWKKVKSHWKLVVDVADPLPLEGKKN